MKVVLWVPISGITSRVGEKVVLLLWICWHRAGEIIQGGTCGNYSFSIRPLDTIFVGPTFSLVVVDPPIEDYLSHIKNILQPALEKGINRITKVVDYLSMLLNTSVILWYHDLEYRSTSFDESLQKPKTIIVHPSLNDMRIEILGPCPLERTNLLQRTLEMIEEYMTAQKQLREHVETFGREKVSEINLSDLTNK
jgi:hypothetical protein